MIVASRWCALALVLLLAPSLGARAETGGGLDPAAIGAAIKQQLADGSVPKTTRRPLDLETLRRFYAQRAFVPVWEGDAAAMTRGSQVRAALATAAEDGLNPADYHQAALAVRPAPASAADAAGDDLLLTDAFLRYAHDLRLGRLRPEEVFGDVALPPQLFDASAALTSALAGGRFAALLAELPPSDPAYARLKDALRRYRALLAAGGWPEIPRGESELKLDGDDPRLPLLRKRLAIEDPALDPSASDRAALGLALRRFQARHGIDPDGRIGRRTLAMLNISAGDRVRQIVANLERWRWLPHKLEPRHVIVNTADGSLRVVVDGQLVLASKVIVGDEKHASPILRAVATAVTVNPPWRVPDSIARKEFLPKLLRDPNYLASENIVILNGPEGDPYGLTIDWHGYSRNRFPFRLEQLPGPNNALGGVKLEMSNRFDVYLHDTPTRKLFARVERKFSHGCIRVEAALALASFALTGDPARDIGSLKEEIAAGETKRHAVRPPLPVWVLYWTAFEDEDGTVEFRPDSYGRDHRLTAALAAASRHGPVATRLPPPHPTPKTSG